MDEQQQYTRNFQRMQLHDISEDDSVIHHHQQQKRISPKENLLNLTHQISDDDLKQAIRGEVKRLATDYDRLISMLQQRSEILEQEYESLQMTEDNYQRRYEKAVREMQFFKKKYDKAVELNKQYAAVNGHRPHSPSIDSNTSSSVENQQLRHATQSPSYGINSSMIPQSPPPSSISGSEGTNPIYNLPPPPLPTSPLPSSSHNIEKARHISRSSSSSTSSSNASNAPYWTTFTSELSPAPPVPRLRQNSNAGIANSIHSSSTDGDSKSNSSFLQARKDSWQQFQQQQPHLTSTGPVPVATSISSPTSPTVARSGTLAGNNSLNPQVIQQRKVDPITFGGSDALWETIAKSKTADSTVEKMIR